MNWYPDYSYVLGSKSPRRQQLLAGMGLPFTVRISDTDEDFPAALGMTEIPVYIAEKKADSLLPGMTADEVVITADTIVWLRGEVLGKPGDADHARDILRKLSNNTHQVITGVCLRTTNRQRSFFSVTEVEFRKLSEQEITYYIESCHPFDKAGAYGIQEWIGLTGITKITGSYFNVVGLPVHQLYQEIIAFGQ